MYRKILIFFLLIISLQSQAQLNVAYYIGSGRYDLYKENYISAVARFTAVINSKPKLTEPWFLRGIAKYNLNDFRGAMEDFSMAIKINPFYSDAFHYRGLTFEQLGDFNNAKEDLASAMELNPANSHIYADMGIIHIMHEEYEKALEYFNESLKIEKTLPDTYFNRAISYVHLGDTVQAINDLKTGIRLNPFSAEALRRLAIIQYEQKNYSEAIANLNQALKLDEGNTLIMFQRAISYYQLENFDKALDDLQAILKIDSTNALVYYNRAVLLTELGRYNEAIDDYTEAINNNPDNILTYYNRAGAKIALNNYQGALYDYNRAIEIFPDFATAYLNRSYVKQMLGDDKGAYLDHMKAEEMIAKYRTDSSDTTEYAQLRDTATDLQQMLDFNSEFSNSFTRGRIQYQTVDIKLQPNYSVQIAQVPPAVNLPFISSFFAYNQSDEHANNIYPRLMVKDTTNIQPATVDSLQQPELFVIQKIIAQAQQANYNKALELLRQSKENFKTLWLYYFLEGTIEASMAEYVFSMSEISTTIKLTEDKTTYRSTSDTRTVVDYSKAEQGLNNSVELNPNFSLCYYNKANIMALSQRFREAIDDYSKAISIDESLPQAYYNRGLTLIYLKEVERGCLDISKAGQLGISDSYNVIKRYCETKKE
ncbi:MAG TPA: tetratricopeptide repeat protein [Salinivirgaceae bacterium]|nr:tetratricopeptide repeat protein [Salinivirgaceae bacterium]